MATNTEQYPVSLDIDYPAQPLNRATTFFRIIVALPILAVLYALTASGGGTYGDAGKHMSANAGSIAGGLFVATLLMILFRQRYPRWWFDFNLELHRFSARVGAYLFLLTDTYPSTVDEQSVHLNITYPDVKRSLNRWMPLVKWFLAIPHYIVLFVLALGVLASSVVAWFAILFTGSYPKGLFDFVVGVGRWGLRVSAYAFLLTTDQYPPFRLT